MRACPACFNRNVQGNNCRICGYDLLTGKAGVDPHTIAGWRMRPLELDVWVGRFPSGPACEAYFVEDGQFLSDQGFEFLDRDFFILEHFPEGLELEEALSRMIIMDGLGQAIARAVAAVRPPGANTLALQMDELPPNTTASTVSNPEMQLVYVGRFRYSGTPE